MKFGDIVTCPTCGKVVKESSITIRRSNLINEGRERDYFEGDNEKLCRKEDNIFIKAFCEDCNKKFDGMLLVDIRPVQYYSAESRDQLVMVDGE